VEEIGQSTTKWTTETGGSGGQINQGTSKRATGRREGMGQKMNGDQPPAFFLSSMPSLSASVGSRMTKPLCRGHIERLEHTVGSCFYSVCQKRRRT